MRSESRTRARLAALALLIIAACVSGHRSTMQPGPTLREGDRWALPWGEERLQSCCRCGLTHVWIAHPWVAPVVVASPGPGGWGWTLHLTGRRACIGAVLELVGVDRAMTDFQTRRLLGAEMAADWFAAENP